MPCAAREDGCGNALRSRDVCSDVPVGTPAVSAPTSAMTTPTPRPTTWPDTSETESAPKRSERLRSARNCVPRPLSRKVADSEAVIVHL